MTWTPADIPDLHGRTALVTGATDGIGLQTAHALAAKGAFVMLAGRNPTKGQAALDRIRRDVPDAEIAFEPVELEDLATVRSLAQRAGARPLDMLINNAGIMGVPRRETAFGFESQLGVNYLSHFVLTGSLLEALRASPHPRVVSLSSLAHRVGRIDFDDLQSKTGYSPFRAYGQSKLAMLMFALELQRRSDVHGWGLTSAAAHPGFARTNLMNAEGASKLVSSVSGVLGTPFFQDAAAGAEPTLLAATRPDLPPASYWGPTGMMELKGSPGPAKISSQAADPAPAARLWQQSQALTDNAFGAGA